MHFRETYIRLLSCALLSVLLPSCELKTSEKSRYTKLATGYCECTAQLAALNQEANAADGANLNAVFQKMQAEYTRTKECAATLVAQFGHLNDAELDSLNQLLLTQCPAVANKRDLLQEMLGE